MQREVGRTGRTQPEVFALSDFAPIAVEAVRVGHKRLCQEQLALVKRSKWDSTSRIRAFMQHELGPVFSGRGVTSARRCVAKCTFVADRSEESFRTFL